MLRKRLPPLTDILPVFAITAVLFYGWSIVVFLWKLPGYLFFLTLGEIAVIFCYELITNLAESLALMAVLLLAAALLPPRALKDSFAVRGSTIALGFIASLIFIIHLATNRLGPAAYWPLWFLAVALAGLALAWIASSIGWAGRAVAGLTDRLIIFLFILLPLSAIALVVVLVRLLS